MEHVQIPMPDGRTSRAHIWLPEDAVEHPVLALLEYLPYRKNDFTAIRDSARHPYLPVTAMRAFEWISAAQVTPTGSYSMNT